MNTLAVLILLAVVMAAIGVFFLALAIVASGAAEDRDDWRDFDRNRKE